MIKSNLHRMLLRIVLCIGFNPCGFLCFGMISAETQNPINSRENFFPASAVNARYIPFQMAGKLIIIQARVDTIIGNFIIDTGCERLVLNQNYFNPKNGRRVLAAGNTGMVESAIVKKVDTLFIEQLKIPNVVAHIVDINHIEQSKKIKIIGILGYNVFEEFELFMDFQNKYIVLNRLDKKGQVMNRIMPVELPYDSIKFDLINHLIVIDGSVNKIPIRFTLDSGAEVNLIDRRVNRKILDSFSIIKRYALVGMGKEKVEVVAGTLNGVKCGNQLCAGMKTLLISIDEINKAIGVNVQGVLGFEFISERRLMINYKKQKLYFFPPQIRTSAIN